MSVGIIVKKYEHFNKALPNWDSPQGKYISSKAQYREEMAKGGFIPYEECQRKVDSNLEKQKYNGVSEKTKKFCYQVKSMADNKGNIQWSDGLVRELKNHGVDYSYFMKLPAKYQTNIDTAQGGLA